MPVIEITNILTVHSNFDIHYGIIIYHNQAILILLPSEWKNANISKAETLGS